MTDSVAESVKRKERLRVFIRMLKKNEYPNYASLQKQLRLEFPREDYHKFTRQTLYRDVKFLNSFHANIAFDHENNNGYYLPNNNWNGYASFLDESEMEAAVLGAQFAERILPPSPLRDKIRGSVDSLWAEHRLPEDDSEVQWNSLVIQGLPVKIDPQVFQTVFEQWRSQHNVEITYTPVKHGRQQTVIIEPHVLVFCNGTWYVRGKSLSRGKRNPEHNDFLTFALHRISAAKRNGSSFTPDLEEINSVNEGRAFDFPLCSGIKLKVKGMALRQALESLPVESEEEREADSAILALKEIEEYKIINFVLVSAGNATILAPEGLKAKAKEQAMAVLNSLK